VGAMFELGPSGGILPSMYALDVEILSIIDLDDGTPVGCYPSGLFIAHSRTIPRLRFPRHRCTEEPPLQVRARSGSWRLT
jgi:hypothetical protein